MVAAVSCRGKDYGSYGSMVEIYNDHTWLDAIRTKDVRFARKGTSGVLTIVAETDEKGGRKCEVTHRLEVPPGGDEIRCEILSVRNVSARRIRFVGVYACPRPFGAEARGENEALSAGHTPERASWRYPDGRAFAIRSTDPALSGVVFARDANGWPHADCRFVPYGRVWLEPGEAFAPPSPYRATLSLE